MDYPLDVYTGVNWCFLPWQTWLIYESLMARSVSDRLQAPLSLGLLSS